MRLPMPLTGTVLVEGTLRDGNLKGDANDPIRIINIDLGHVSWQLVDIDWDNELAIIEVTPSEYRSVPTGGKITVNGKETDEYETRPATEEEKVAFLQHAQDLVMNHTKDELYTMSKCSRLKRPFKKK